MTNEFILSIVLTLGEFESGNNDAAIGAKGERGRHQITEAKWVETTASRKLHWKFETCAHLPAHSEFVCEMIVGDIIKINHAYGPKEIYAEYNGGHHGRNRGVVKARARRFEKLWRAKYDPKRTEFKGARQKRQ